MSRARARPPLPLPAAVSARPRAEAAWTAALTHLAEVLPPSIVEGSLRPLTVAGLSGRELALMAAEGQDGGWLRTRYGLLIATAVREQTDLAGAAIFDGPEVSDE